MTRKVLSTGLILLIILILILIKIFFFNQEPFGKDNSSFAIDPSRLISRVEMSFGEEELILQNKDGNWQVNGNPGVNKSTISTFLTLLSEIQIKSPVSDDLFTEWIVNPGINPVEVKVFIKNRVAGAYLVYNTESNDYGNIMKTSERSKPFIVYAPGFEKNIASFFNVNEQAWLPYTVFNYMPSEIMSVTVSYREDEQSSFRINNYSGKFVLEDVDDYIRTDSLKVLRYISYFTYISFEKWANDMSAETRDSIINSPPYVTIAVKGKDSQDIVLTLWEKLTEYKGEIIPDTDRIFGRTDKTENIFIMRYFDIDPILKKREYFIKK